MKTGIHTQVPVPMTSMIATNRCSPQKNLGRRSKPAPQMGLVYLTSCQTLREYHDFLVLNDLIG